MNVTIGEAINGYKILPSDELTMEEMILYSNWEGIETCDCCGNYRPMTNIIFNGIQFLCIECNK